jgi:hypothetical protein
MFKSKSVTRLASYLAIAAGGNGSSPGTYLEDCRNCSKRSGDYMETVFEVPRG